MNVLTRRTKARLTGLSGLAVAALVAVVASGPANAAVSDEPSATPAFNGPVFAVATAGDVVYVGGEFTAAVVKGKQVARQRLAAINVATGTLLDWAPAADRTVRALAVDSGGRVGRRRLPERQRPAARQPREDLHAPACSTRRRTRSPAGRRARSPSGTAGSTSPGCSPASTARRAATWRRSTSPRRRCRPGPPRTDDLVTSLAVGGDRIYLGGSFHRTNGVSSTGRLIAVKSASGAVDSGFRPQPDAIVWGIAVSGDRVYAALGGRGGRAVSYTTGGVAKWAITTDGDAQAVAVLGSTVYIGGHFDNVCRSARNGDHGVCLDGNGVPDQAGRHRPRRRPAALGAPGQRRSAACSRSWRRRRPVSSRPASSR